MIKMIYLRAGNLPVGVSHDVNYVGLLTTGGGPQASNS